MATIDGDGFITVAHTPPVGRRWRRRPASPDGIDKIRNFEILNFADGNVFLDPTIVNTPATGLLAIIDGGNAGITVGEPVTVALGTVADLDGVPPMSAFTFTWQFEQTPGPGDWADVADPLTGDPVTGVTFIPTALTARRIRLRVVGRSSMETASPSPYAQARRIPSPRRRPPHRRKVTTSLSAP